MGLLTLSTMSFADLTADQQYTLKAAGVDNYSLVYENKNVKIVSTPYSFVSFYGNSTTFSIDRVYQYNTKLKMSKDLISYAMVQDLEPYKNSFINVKAKNEKLHAYVIFNIECPYCHKLIADVQKFLDQGVSLTFVPYVNYRKANENLKVSYILNQPANKRFALIQQNSADIPLANAPSMFLPTVDKLMDKYLISSYPIMITDDGYATIKGYESFEKSFSMLKGLLHDDKKR
ncbi:thioredoxin domain-containing protein [Psittacicella hinzii]|uniref:Uncharacterized protein n=1 Tax=Psittacicella hinzii TaxID=2028575 RepID=A0A3A1YJS7_9GAMM|nr:thioredoxin fold domain-containing protein [Psittacicella hinzii]RIY38523.1 hypothetical protein CKF58_04170 [Psittacicella hinzii]